MRISELGEFGLIAELVKQFGSRDDVVLGPGDDTAVVRMENGTLLLLTTDTLIERVHFRREQISAPDVGWKALAVSLSDIAAMGGTPRWATVSVTVPAGLEVDWCSMLCQGVSECAEEYCTTVVGGNVARSVSGDISIDSFIVGTVDGERYVARSGAQPGDVILLTGNTGLAAAGLGCLDRGLAGEPFAEPLVRAFTRPVPRVIEGRAAAAEPGVTAMIDVSDGLLGDLGHICESSGVGAEIDSSKVSVSKELRDYGDAAEIDPLFLALAGGEDYELVITCWSDSAGDFAERIGATVIGTMRSGKDVTVVDADGRPIEMGRTGWNHMGGKDSGF